MNYREIIPADRLKQYVRCYYIFESESAIDYDDTVFPSGSMEIIFNLGTGQWQAEAAGGFVTTPAVELWGQITKPLPIRSLGKNTMLGIRFFPYGAAHFMTEAVDAFNDQVIDFAEVDGKDTESLYARLLETPDWNKRIALIESYLYSKLSASQRTISKNLIVSDIIRQLREDSQDNSVESLALQYGISSRYLHKLFTQQTGLTPKLYSKINRFQNSLKLVAKKNASLTSVAYECGYFDQSHFIKEFKSFTGVTPSGYTLESSPLPLAFAV